MNLSQKDETRERTVKGFRAGSGWPHHWIRMRLNHINCSVESQSLHETSSQCNMPRQGMMQTRVMCTAFSLDYESQRTAFSSERLGQEVAFWPWGHISPSALVMAQLPWGLVWLWGFPLSKSDFSARNCSLTPGYRFFFFEALYLLVRFSSHVRWRRKWTPSFGQIRGHDIVHSATCDDYRRIDFETWCVYFVVPWDFD
jgi:hypothetical protein